MTVSSLLALLFVVVSVLGLVVSWLAASQRVRRERRDFRLAAQSALVEVPRYLLLGLVPALVLGPLLIILGLRVSTAFVLAFAVVTAVNVLLPAYSPLLISIVPLFSVLLQERWGRSLGLVSSKDAAATAIMLVGLLCALNALACLFTPYHNSPRLRRRHGRKWAAFSVRQLLLFPLLVPIPGQLFAALPFSHVLGITGGWSLALLPVVLGFGFTNRGGYSRHTQHRRAWIEGVTGLLIAATGCSMVLSGMSSTLVLLVVAVLGLLAYGLELFVSRGRYSIGVAAGGVRVVAVLDGTPAARMHLHRGDTVLQCNGQDVPTAAALYAATQELGTFCRLRVQNRDGELRLAETAIFAGSPHMLGIITFAEEEQ
ncbi:PDZ domain-containing protein [Lacticaseibacillus zhaodongensis]|uniref:PDZ domain-containing protein n=1 Tax=Lacticaseibacillus zhaodongensis TaxID=2668065 RepID=UPI0012D36750|nr:PDZ domain-containing protein [Lacticaseibacillus zhaodongensis]